MAWFLGGWEAIIDKPLYAGRSLHVRMNLNFFRRHMALNLIDLTKIQTWLSDFLMHVSACYYNQTVHM